MEHVLSVVAVKTCSVVALALAAALAGRYLKRPAVVHVLWIVVLLELLVPPVFEIGVLPRVALPGTEAAPISTVAALPVPIPHDVPLPVAIGEDADPSLDAMLTLAALAIWLAGSLGVLLLAAVRIRRFRRLLTHATDATAPLEAVVARLAARLGLSRAPRIRLVPARISPMLWPGFGSLEILFPAPLLGRLGAAERDTLLAHELAHVRRKDHWVRHLELIVGALFWWHPVVWWARSRLREVEEQCCDDLVLRTLPEHARDYAKGLVKTVEFLAGARTGLPSLASGVGEARILKGRLAMILKHRSPKNLSGPQRLGLALVAAGLLLVYPTWADRAPQEDAELRAQEQELLEAEAMVRAGVLDLERHAQQLEQELREVRAQQRELEHSLHRQREGLEIRRLELGAVQHEAAGQREAAEELRRLQDRLREEFELQARHNQFEQDRARQMLEIERRLVDAEASRERGELERAAELAAQAEELRTEFRAVARETREHQVRALQEELEMLTLKLRKFEAEETD